MERYDYRNAVKEDIKQYFEDNDVQSLLDEVNGDMDELEQMLSDILWIEDSVTGNASGSYTFNTWKAEEYICHNLDLVEDAYSEFGGTPDMMNPEAIDVTIRCYLLGECLHEAIEETF